MHWQPEGDGYRCLRHDVAFDRTESCIECACDPGPPLTSETPDHVVQAPFGCLTSIEHEQRLTGLGDWLAKHGKALIKKAFKPEKGDSDKTDDDAKFGVTVCNAGVKMIEASIKALNAAAAYTHEREDKAHVRRLEQAARELKLRSGVTH